MPTTEEKRQMLSHEAKHKSTHSAFTFAFETGSSYVAYTGLELTK